VKLGPRGFLQDERGNIALIFALGMPAVIMLSIGAVELFSLHSDKQKLQDVADAVALAAANELTLSSAESVIARAKANALHQAASVAAHSEVTADARTEELEDEIVGVTVEMRMSRLSFFGNLLPPGGFHLKVSATASGMNKVPLCVLGVSPTVKDGVNVDRGVITAGGCVVHSNHDIRVNTGSSLAATVVQAVGMVTGTVPAGARDGAPAIDDPFSALVTAPPDWNTCLAESKKAEGDEILELDAGVHCGHFDIDKDAILRLRPGVHYFRDKLQMKEDSRLEGEFATVVFGKNLELQVDSQDVRWDLLGSQTGVMAGFVFVLDRARTKEIVLPAAMIERLEGVVYAPQAVLKVDGAADAAEESAWTVVVGRELRLTNNANMFINSDYASSSVPVPAGVGEKAAIGFGGNRLVD
jgi:Flp pilus assembly protein TadG